MEQNEQFDRIYESTRDDLLRFLMLRTNAAPEAEDLFQEIYRRFYLRLQKNAFPIRNPKWYLFSVAGRVLSGKSRTQREGAADAGGHGSDGGRHPDRRTAPP